MKKLYISDNYIIAENDGVNSEYAMGKTVYSFANSKFTILETTGGRLEIPLADVGDWFDETGLIAYNETTLTSFLRTNSGFSLASVSGATNNVIVTSMDDLPDLIGGKVPLKDATNYIVASNSFVLTNPLDLSNITGFSSFSGGLNVVPYSGTEDMIQGTFTGAFLFGNIIVPKVTPPSTIANVWDLKGNGDNTSNILVLTTITFAGFSGQGVIDTVGGMNAEAQYADCGEGLVLKDIPLLSINNSPINNSVTSNSPRIVLDGTFVSAKISGSALTIQSGESFLQISKNFVISGDFTIFGQQYSDSLGGEFYASKKAGSITVFSDNGAGGTTVTSADHGLTIEQVVEIAGTTSYNGIQQDIFNVTTNTYDIPVVFVADDATGSWDTGDSSVFRDNNNFDSELNGDDPDSNEITKFKSNTTIPVTIALLNTPVDVLGNAIDWSPLLERRFELQAAGDPNGSVRYTGKRQLPFRMSARITVDVVGGASKEMTGYITINGVTQVDSKFTAQSGRPITLNPEDLVNLSENDYIGVSIENNDDATNIDVLFVNMNIIKA